MEMRCVAPETAVRAAQDCIVPPPAQRLSNKTPLDSPAVSPAPSKTAAANHRTSSSEKKRKLLALKKTAQESNTYYFVRTNAGREDNARNSLESPGLGRPKPVRAWPLEREGKKSAQATQLDNPTQGESQLTQLDADAGGVLALPPGPGPTPSRQRTPSAMMASRQRTPSATRAATPHDSGHHVSVVYNNSKRRGPQTDGADEPHDEHVTVDDATSGDGTTIITLPNGNERGPRKGTDTTTAMVSDVHSLGPVLSRKVSTSGTRQEAKQLRPPPQRQPKRCLSIHSTTRVNAEIDASTSQDGDQPAHAHDPVSCSKADSANLDGYPGKQRRDLHIASGMHEPRGCEGAHMRTNSRHGRVRVCLHLPHYHPWHAAPQPTPTAMLPLPSAGTRHPTSKNNKNNKNNAYCCLWILQL